MQQITERAFIKIKDVKRIEIQDHTIYKLEDEFLSQKEEFETKVEKLNKQIEENISQIKIIYDDIKKMKKKRFKNKVLKEQIQKSIGLYETQNKYCTDLNKTLSICEHKLNIIKYYEKADYKFIEIYVVNSFLDVTNNTIKLWNWKAGEYLDDLEIPIYEVCYYTISIIDDDERKFTLEETWSEYNNAIEFVELNYNAKLIDYGHIDK